MPRKARRGPTGRPPKSNKERYSSGKAKPDKIKHARTRQIQLKHTVMKLIQLWEQYDRPATLENLERVKHLYSQLQLLRIAAVGENTSWANIHDLPPAAQLIHLVEKCFLAHRDKWKHTHHND